MYIVKSKIKVLIISFLLFSECSAPKDNSRFNETVKEETIEVQNKKEVLTRNEKASPSVKEVGLQNRVVLSNKAEILLPDDFQIMDKKMLDFKYPSSGNRPTEVYTNPEASVNIAFNHTSSPVKPFELSNVKGPMVQQIKNTPGVEILEEGIRTINGRDFIILKFFSQAIDTRVYNFMFVTSLNNRLLLGTFNCTDAELPEWKEQSEVIVNSLKIF